MNRIAHPTQRGPAGASGRLGRSLVIGLLLVASPLWAEEKKPDPLSQPQLKALLRALSRSQSEDRRTALELLEKHAMAAHKAGAVPRLIGLARRDPDRQVRIWALRVLAEMGPAVANQVTPTALRLAKDLTQGRLGAWALYVLGKVKAPVRRVGPLALVLLGAPDDFTRTAARGTLIDLDDEVVPLLVGALTTARSRYRRERLAVVLAERKGRAKRALPSLRRLLEQTPSDDTERRLLLLGLILSIEPKEADKAVPSLMKLLGRARGRQRYGLIRGLGKIGPPAAAALPQLARETSSKDNGDRAVEAMASIVTPATCGPWLKLLSRLLGHSSWSRGHHATGALGRCGEAGRRALLRATEQAHHRGRANAWRGLKRFAPLPWTELRRRYLRESSASVRDLIADQLGRAAKTGGKPCPGIVALLELEDDASARSGLASALGHCGALAVEPLMRALADPHRWVRQSAMRALTSLGPAAVGVIPRLLKGPGSSKYRGSHISINDTAGVVSSMGAVAIPALGRALKHDDARMRANAAYALGRLGAPALPLVPSLSRAVDDEVEEVRQWSAWALGKIGPAAKQAVPDLRSALTDPKGDVRRWAAEALGKLGAHAAEAVPDLIRLLNDPVTDNAAAEALGAIGPPARAAIPTLVKLLATSDDRYLRRAVAEGLGTIGRRTSTVQTALRRGLTDPSATVRRAAARSLLKVGTTADLVPAQRVITGSEDAVWKERYRGMEQLRRTLRPVKIPKKHK